MKNVISGMAYFFATALAVLIILMIIATLNMQRLGFTENETDGYDELNELNLPELDGEKMTDLLSPSQQTGKSDKSDKTNDNSGGNTDGEYLNNSNPGDNIAPVFNVNSVAYAGDLELPVNGASGYASVDMEMFLEDLTSVTLKAGTAFTVIEELTGADAGWWQISVNGITGTVRHILCMINLPDVIPSIIYNNANAYKSVFRAGGKDIPNITGRILYSYSDAFDKYSGKAYNPRFQRYEYIVPVLYSMSKRICAAQKNALENGDTLVIYEGFRPAETQQLVYKEVQALAGSDAEVRRTLNSGSWSIGWFIASGTSNHQEGYAIDTTLGRVVSTEDMSAGDYKYVKVKNYYEYGMPTDIHDLGSDAAVYTGPYSRTYTAAMNESENAKALQKYCTDAGLSTLASEWWHFNDEYTRSSMPRRGNGRYEIKECVSIPPTA